MSRSLLHLFTTPLVALALTGVGDLNRDLCAAVLAERARSPGLHRSNVGGWHSADDLPDREDPWYHALYERLDAAFVEAFAQIAAPCNNGGSLRAGWRWQGWAMVMEAGHYSAPHDHSDADWSCVYDADAGDPPPPDNPRAGALTLFGARPRISVASNLRWNDGA